MADAPKSEERRVNRVRPAAGIVKARSTVASTVWLVAVVCALCLAVAALLRALEMNERNDIVSFVTAAAEFLDFGSFKKFRGADAAIKETLTDWGIAAVIYLMLGKLLDRVIRA